MPDHESPGATYEPDFELPNHKVITEENWTEYRAKGYLPQFTDSLISVARAQDLFGVENVLTGDAFDFDEKRPLHHKPGIGIYVSPAGLKRYADQGGPMHDPPSH